MPAWPWHYEGCLDTHDYRDHQEAQHREKIYVVGRDSSGVLVRACTAQALSEDASTRNVSRWAVIANRHGPDSSGQDNSRAWSDYLSRRLDPTLTFERLRQLLLIVLAGLR